MKVYILFLGKSKLTCIIVNNITRGFKSLLTSTKGLAQFLRGDSKLLTLRSTKRR